MNTKERNMFSERSSPCGLSTLLTASACRQAAPGTLSEGAPSNLSLGKTGDLELGQLPLRITWPLRCTCGPGGTTDASMITSMHRPLPLPLLPETARVNPDIELWRPSPFP
ncbi:hypothetical protein RSOLAG1IB_10455 [Rhizoctonia solani AG-1 IB]|uniref:Uncharacterized protein n=1 Tax=Thanatephorus cucumeris (strain AG1-IB / isolate 7/3/14) TaxID=1108050 RepID=A0A0B7FZY3_THACB|nr:hypothetical protein RSOLAG1IB_10455 [Rhizoctonia solani AG-1 IB]